MVGDGGIPELQQMVRRFAQDRDWGQFHTPKNLVMALGGEVGELTALFQWLATNEKPDRHDLEGEVADVFIYLLQLADVLDIDLDDAVRSKLRTNATRYPVGLATGSSAKYDKLKP